MHSPHATRDQLIAENAALRQRVADLEAAEAKRQQAPESRNHTNELLRRISQIQSEFIAEAEPQVSVGRLLHTLLTLTHSEYGFIGEIRQSVTGARYLKMHAMTNIAWDRDSQALYERYESEGLEFRNMQTLFGAVVITGEPVIANSPSTDPRCGGLPAGHPPLHAFLGLPFAHGGTVLGMVGIANRPGGYDQTWIEFLQPALLTCGVMLNAHRQVQQRQQAEDALRKSEQRYRQLMEHSLGLLCIHDLDGILLEVNRAAAQTLGYQPQDGVGKSLRTFIAPEAQHQFDEYLARIRQNPTDSGLLRIVTRHGEERIWMYRNVRCEEPNAPPYVLGHAIDITERIETEQALKQTHEMLERRVAERTAALQRANAALEAEIAERAQIETALRVSEQRYRQFVNSSQGLICTHDLEGVILSVNPAAAQALGQEPRAIVGKNLRTFLATSVQHRFDPYLERMRDHGTARGLMRVATHAGDERVFAYHNCLIQNASEAPCVLGLAQDVTDRVRVEAELRASEAKFRDLIEGSIQGILIHRDNHVLFVNQAYAEIFGYATLDELYRLDSPLSLVAPQDRERLLSYRDDRLAGREVPAHYEYQGRRQDGSLVWLAMTVRRVTWDEQPAMQSIVVDITERKRAEEALRQSEEQYRSLIEGSLQGVSITCGDKRLFVNTAFARILGYEDPNALIGQPIRNHVARHEWARLRANARARLRGDPAPSRYEFQGVRTDGALIWLEIMVSPITWQGRPARLSTLVDITERKHAEEERQRLEAQLHQMQKMDAIGALAGGIAHEFNNMLTVILGYTQLASANTPAGSPMSEYLQAVETAGNRAKDLVQQLLAFSHPSDRKREAVSLAEVIQEALKLLRASLPATIEIRQRIALETGAVLADATQLHQVLMNLCANAEYAMRETGGILEIRTDNIEIKDTMTDFHLDLQPGSYVRVRVQDMGTGIPTAAMGRIFEPFFTTKEVGEGTGMGLAIVHGIVTSHGGAIRAESKPGEGTTFTLYLPRIPDAAPDATPASEPVIPQGAGRILFVDDEELLTRLAKEWLVHLGYEVVVCTSGLEALDLFQKEPHRFDLVITDQTMPAMTGAILAEELRRIRSDIPIILCTGFSHLMNAEKAEALGVDAFVMKPSVTEELAATIQQVLKKRAQ